MLEIQVAQLGQVLLEILHSAARMNASLESQPQEEVKYGKSTFCH
jgi:hypothetical protein